MHRAFALLCAFCLVTIVTAFAQSPTSIGIYPPWPGTYHAGDTLEFRVGWPFPVDISGPLRLSFNAGKVGTSPGNSYYAEYSRGSGTSSTYFVWTVPAGVNDSDGISAFEVQQNGATITSYGSPVTVPPQANQTVISYGPVLIDTTTPATPPTVIDTPLATGEVNATYVFRPFTENSPTSLAISGLPAGLQADDQGMITGMVSAPWQGNITITATNVAGTATRTMPLSILPAGSPTLAGNDTVTINQTYYSRVDRAATGNITSLTVDNVPPGMAVSSPLNPNDPSIEGRPSVAGTYYLVWHATNSVGEAVTSSRLVVLPSNPTIVTQVVPPAAQNYATGDTMTFQVKFTGPVTVSDPSSTYLNVDMPSAEDLYPLPRRAYYTSGSGTDTLSFSYRVTNLDDPAPNVSTGNGYISGALRDSSGALLVDGWVPPTLATGVTVNVGPPIFYGPLRVSGTVGVDFAFENIWWRNFPASITADALPPGMHVVNGYVSGAPTTAGTYTMHIHASNSYGSEDHDITVIITDAAASGTPPAIETTAILGIVGQPINAGIYVSPTSTFTADQLPAGVSLSSSGHISGTPEAAGTSISMITVQNGSGSVTAAFTFAISTAPYTSAPTTPPSTSSLPPTPTPPPTTTPPPSGTKTDQTITFSSPVSAIIVGQPITLGATSSAGLPITYTVVSGDAKIDGNTLTPLSTASLVVRASSTGNDTYNAASVDVNFGTPQRAAQAITLVSSGGDVVANNAIALNATSSSGLPVTFTVVSGPATISGSTLSFTGTGAVVVRASQPGGDAYAPATDVTLTYTAHPMPRLVNVSSRLHLGAGEAAIAGFVVTGSTPKQILVRAVGDSLTALGVSDPVANPHLTVFDNNRLAVATNAGWADDPQIAAADTAVGAFTLKSGSSDAALIVTLAPGAYTAQVTSPSSGSVLVEVYDLGANDAVPTKQLVNVSTRAHVDASNPIIQGFVVSGDQPKRVLIRAVGAPLSQFGVTDAINDPSLTLYSGSTVVARNDDWATPQPVGTQVLGSASDIAAASTAVGTFPLPSGSKDAAILLTLAPGPYTVIVGGTATDSGEVLVEAYDAP